MRLRIISPLANRGTETLIVEVTTETLATIVGQALAVNRLRIVDLIDSNGLIIKRFSNWCN